MTSFGGSSFRGDLQAEITRLIADMESSIREAESFSKSLQTAEK